MESTDAPLSVATGSDHMDEFSTDGVIIERITEPSGPVPTLIEGLPGVGMVGKLAVEHLLEERDSELVARFYSEHFPPQVSVDNESVASLPVVSLHHVVTERTDVFLLAGDYQSATSVGHYRLTSAVLNVATEFGLEHLFAIGGVPTGELLEDPSVIGTVSDPGLRKRLENSGVEFREKVPSGGVVGVSGLLVGLGERRGIEATCLMGETSGYVVDPKSARAVLHILEDIVDLDIDYTKLEDRAEQMEAFVRRLQEMQEEQVEVPGDEDLRYIG